MALPPQIPAEIAEIASESWAADIIRMAATQIQPQELRANTRYVLTTASGDVKVLDFTTPEHLFADGSYLPRPFGTFRFDDSDSFVDYIKSHGMAKRTEIWANDRGAFVAVLDGHARDVETEAARDNAGWGLHRAELQLKSTVNWLAWLKTDRQALDQATFAEFLDDNLSDIAEPDGASLLEMVSKLSLTSDFTFTSHLSLATGESKLIYAEDLKKGDIILPSKITLGVSPFVGLPPYKITARLRFKVASQKVAFKFLLDKREDVESHAICQVAKDIAAKTGLTVYQGQAAEPVINF